VYGVPTLHGAWRVAVGLAAGSVLFVSLGVLLGTLLPSARSAQAVGLLLFFPSFLLGAGGPPPHVMGPVLHSIAKALPLTLVTDSVREPWLGIGAPDGQLLVVVGLAAVAMVASLRRAAL
jgi:ABC-2 type transport system permease protein